MLVPDERTPEDGSRNARSERSYCRVRMDDGRIGTPNDYGQVKGCAQPRANQSGYR
jgi:hypothetical protein